MKAFLTNNRILFQLYITLLITTTVIWTISLWIVSIEHYLPNPFTIWFHGIVNQLLIASFSTLVLFPFTLLFRHKWFYGFIYFLFVVVALFEMISTYYFIITLRPLDAILFQFDPSQMQMIAGDFVIFHWYYLLLILPPLIFAFTYRFIRSRNNTLIATPIWIGSLILILFTGFQYGNTNGIFDKLSQNKTYFFLSSLLKENSRAINIHQATACFQTNEDKSFTSKSYPLLHQPSNKNPLRPFFELNDEPPNIVFIIVESLSSSFSGINADEISYTPFLDSLSDHSIYFENALATGERTFAVLPSVLGSLPHGKKGFTHEQYGYPSSNSLLKWLSQKGYESRFFYGGHARFDYMDLYLNDQGIDRISDRNEFDYSDSDKKTSEDPVPFGISDRELIQDVVQYQSQAENNKPFLDIILTLSMHYPFIIEDAAYYENKVKSIIEKANASAQLKEKHTKYIKPLSTFLYTDHVIADYFKQMQKTDQHENTVYIIMGDHMMSDIPHRNPIEKYRSPLMIYSPLLTRSKRVKAVNSHLDITPSLYQLLIQPYDLKEIKEIHWLGEPFDTTEQFSSSRNILFMRNDRSYTDFLMGDHYLSYDKLYAVQDRLQMKNIEDEDTLQKIKQTMKCYEKIHRFTVDKNKIKPGNFGTKTFQIDNKHIEMNDSVSFAGIIEHQLQKDRDMISVSIEFSLLDGWEPQKSNTEEGQPLLVMAVDREGKNTIWKRVEIDLSENAIGTPQEITFSLRENLQFELQKGDQVKLYFWNKDKNGKTYTVLAHEIKIYEN